MWFPILQWRNKTFCKFWYFDSGKCLKLLVTIIVTGNNKWFTSFCFLSWFRKNEMWRNKTFQLNIKSWHRDDGLLQPIMFPNIYCTVLRYFQSQTVLEMAHIEKSDETRVLLRHISQITRIWSILKWKQTFLHSPMALQPRKRFCIKEIMKIPGFYIK